MASRFLTGQRGYSLAWTAAFLAFLLVPLLVLGIEIRRWEHARGELYKAADLAALAAAAEVDIPHFRDTGEVRLLPGAAEVARRYVAANTGNRPRNGISAYVAGIGVDPGPPGGAGERRCRRVQTLSGLGAEGDDKGPAAFSEGVPWLCVLD